MLGLRNHATLEKYEIAKFFISLLTSHRGTEEEEKSEAKIRGILCTCYIHAATKIRTYERTNVHRAVKIYDDRMDGRLHRPWSYTI